MDRAPDSFLTPLLVDRLTVFLIGFIGLHAASLGSSSFVEEEHQLWYHYSASFLLLLFFITLGARVSEELPLHSQPASMPAIPSSPPPNLAVSGGQGGVANPSVLAAGLSPAILKRRRRWHLGLLLGVLIGERVCLRRLHATGDAWIHLPDIADWLTLPENSGTLFELQLFAWLLLIAYRVNCIWSQRHAQFLGKENRYRLFSFFTSFSIVTLTGVATTQLVYRYLTTRHMFSSDTQSGPDKINCHLERSPVSEPANCASTFLEENDLTYKSFS
ncbi:unnamed protein product [Protopolystoma xenopodis]|uniref:Uncharacterized protein n=1 Tax=Protopolystoma xenopodis TaxID=117903 RepID=A0A3S5BQ44_9PLAT|nr:unnamed protein product [Protopolystoma xenopodis]